MAEHNSLGKWGEEICRLYLVAHGYAVIEQNWRMGHLEIDLIAQKDNRIHFVEVKTRKVPVDAPDRVVTPAKRRNLVAAADVYMRSHRLPFEAVFDVFFVVGQPHSYTVEHIPDAFRPTLRSR